MKKNLCLYCFMLLSLLCYGQQEQLLNSLKSDVKLLLTSKTLDVRDKSLFFNGNELIVINDRKIYIFPLEGEEGSVSAGFLPENINKLEQLIYSGNNTFIKDGSSILQLQDSTVNLFIKMPHNDFSIYPANEKNFYVVIQENNNSELFLISTETNKSSKLLSSPEKISNVVGTDERTIVAIGNDIFLLEGKETILIHHNETFIKSLTGSEYGLFIASEKGLSYLCLPFIIIPILEENTQKVICNNNTVIVLLEDGRLFEINNANSFENRIRTFVNNANHGLK